VSGPKNKEDAPAGESGSRRQKRKKDKLIRLDDLIPKENVVGGHQVLFGVTDTQETNQNKKEEE